MRRAQRMLADARLEERLARARFQDSLGEFQGRSTPSSLAGEAIGKAREAGDAMGDMAIGTVKKRPGTFVAIGVAAALFFARKPIARTIKSRLARRKETKTPDQSFDYQETSVAKREHTTTPAPILTEEVQ